MMPIEKKHRAWYTICGIIISLIVFGSGMFVGTVLSVRQSVLDEHGDVQIEKVLDLYSKTRSEEISFDQFWAVWDRIKEKHVDKDISDVDLMYSAIEGLVKGTNDPYSVYFPPQEAREFVKELSGEFEGIGAHVGLEEEFLTIVAPPISKSPAEKAGLRQGDKILAINGEDTYGLTVDAAVNKIRGKRGTSVVLTIQSEHESKSKDISITRDVINVPTIEVQTKPGNIAYMRINVINGETWQEFDKAVKTILSEQPEGIILDLRSNPGGFLETSIDIASEWIPQGTIVSEQFSNGEKTAHASRGAHRLQGIKTIVLVDGGTASGAEIISGALQDYGLATIIGQHTYGKGSVQDVEPFADGSALKLTIAKWLTPKDRQIEKQGILPDIEIEEMFTIDESLPDGDKDKIIDNGVLKAMELLTN